MRVHTFTLTTPAGGPIFRGPLFNVNKAMHLIGAHAPRLRALLKAHGDEVRLTCTHNPHELGKFLEGKLP